MKKKILILDRKENLGYEIVPVEETSFWAREVPVPEAAAAMVAELEEVHSKLRAWMDAAYQTMTTPRSVPPEFPKDLLNVKISKTQSRSKAGPKKRVRARSSGDAKSSED